MAMRSVPDGGPRPNASPTYERVPPHNVEAEESVLGSMLLSRDAIAEVLELLHEDDFYRPAHRTVFRSVLDLYSHGQAVDPVTVAEELRRSGELADVGGATGFPELDRLTSGLQASNLIIVAARPAVGKSTLGLDVARNASVRSGVPTVVFSLEMSKTELVQRLMCAECSVDMQRLRTGRMEDSDWTRLTRSLGRLAEAPLFIDDSAAITMMELRAKCRRLKQRHGLGLVVVDYLQLMQPSKRVESRQQEVSEISRALKLLAKELAVPVIAISQLSRQTEARSDKKPMLSDLRESGALEQDADMVMIIYREDLYDPESPRKGEADLIVAKHRNGPTDTVTVTFQGQYSRFAPMAARSL